MTVFEILGKLRNHPNGKSSLAGMDFVSIIAFLESNTLLTGSDYPILSVLSSFKTSKDQRPLGIFFNEIAKLILKYVFVSLPPRILFLKIQKRTYKTLLSSLHLLL